MTPLRKILSLTTLLVFASTCFSLAQAPSDVVIQPPSGNSVNAEVWPFAGLEKIPSKVAFEQWRGQVPNTVPQNLALGGLAIPTRKDKTIVRISGVLHAPVTGNYAFMIHAPGKAPTDRPDDTELWILDDTTGQWKLAQTAGNPVKRDGRTRLVQGAPRRFELWTIGKSAVSVDWEVRDWDSVAKGPVVALDRQLVPASAIKPRAALPDDKNGIGLRDSWKQRNGLAPDKTTGSDSPWGDPDRDGLPNWQEQRHNLDPLNADGRGAAGLVLWEIWRGIPGQYVFDLHRAPHFPTGARETRYLDRLVIPTGNGDQYGSRLRGLLLAPADGEYTFKVSADDSTELWLGTNETWQTKRLLARTDQRGRVPGLPEQTATVTLKAGQKYYLEVLYKQEGGSDFCAISWKIPGSEKSAIISSQHLSSWKPCPTDLDDDGLPDEWQRSSGLSGAAIAQDLRHCEADADFDGASNRDEWLAGTNPLNAANFPVKSGMLTCHAWTGMPGHHIEALVKNSNFPAKPYSSIHIDNLDFKHEGDNYGLRIRGYLTAPENGNYSFSIAGNNAAILYLGTSEDKFTKRVVSRVEVGTNWRSFHSGGSENQGAIRLEKGKKYYIEVIYKRGVNGKRQENQIDHSSVAWTRPGRKASVIPADFFTPYQSDPRDADDDDLPDEWEKIHSLDPAEPSGKNGAWGDTDGDGLENLREFQRGLNPTVPDVHGKPGLALWEGWYNVEDLITEHKEGSGLAAALYQDPRFPHKASKTEWRSSLDAPRRQGTNFGARLRAHIVAPVTGDYVFSIAGRDVGELFLSADASKFNRRSIASIRYGTIFRAWEMRAEQISPPIHLEAGKIYYIEALYGRGAFQQTDDFFSIGWKIPQSKEFKLINSKNLIAFHRDPNDQDDDDLPDDWETRYGLDATDPRGADGPQGDPDRDRYTNAEELRLGTNPTNRDSDGDGISDYDELHTYKTNPLVKDTIPPVELQSFPLTSAAFPNPLTWKQAKDGSLVSVSRRGSMSFEFELEKSGICILEIVAASVSASSFNPPIPFHAEVNGAIIGSASASSSIATYSWMTPWLAAGKHTFTVNNRNLRAGSSLVIHSVKLLRHDGEDKDGNGVVDWLENILLRNNSVNDATLSSATSPACIEGMVRYEGGVRITVAGEEVKINTGISSGWYANVPLDKMKKTALHATFEGGALNQTWEIEWLETNLLTCPSKLIVRVGDSLKVRAQSEDEKASYLITCDGEKIANGETHGFSILTFDKAGEHKITVRSSDQSANAQRTISVSVVTADFGKTFDVASGSTRKWHLPNVPRELILQADPILTLKDLDRKPGQSRIVNITSSAPLAAYPVVLARTQEGGAIVASTHVESFYFAPASITGNSSVIRTLPDGTRVVRVTYAIDGKVPADLSIWIQLYVTDAVFTNGDSWYELTAADFNANGEASLEILKAPGLGTPYVCHWINPFMESPDEEADTASAE